MCCLFARARSAVKECRKCPVLLQRLLRSIRASRLKKNSTPCDPRPFVKRELLDLLINLDNPKQYYVDLTFLPAKA
jgi:hypothetical protein